MARSVGFIGGGRITRVLLEGWRRAGETPPRVVVSDVDAKAVDLVRTRFPGVTALASDNREATATDVVFLAVHPPAMKAVLACGAMFLRAPWSCPWRPSSRWARSPQPWAATLGSRA
jgi:pyrroline-5-carboxylate reductase